MAENTYRLSNPFRRIVGFSFGASAWDFFAQQTLGESGEIRINTFKVGRTQKISGVAVEPQSISAIRAKGKPFVFWLDTATGWRKVTPTSTEAQASINPLADRANIGIFGIDVSESKFGGVVYNDDPEDPGPVLFDGVTELEFARPEYEGDGGAGTPICIATKTQHFAAWQTAPNQENAGSIIVGLASGTIHANADGTSQIAQCPSFFGGKSGFAVTANYYNIFFALIGRTFPDTNPQSVDISSDAGSLLFVNSAPDPLIGGIVGFKATKDQLFVCGETPLSDTPDDDGNYTIRVAIHKFQRQENGTYVHSVTSRDVLSAGPSGIVRCFEVSESAGHAYIKRTYVVDPEADPVPVQFVAEIQNSDGSVMTVADQDSSTTPDILFWLDVMSSVHSVSLKTRACFILWDGDDTGARSRVRFAFTDGETIFISGTEGNNIDWSAGGFVGTADDIFCSFVDDGARYFAGTDGTSVNVTALFATEVLTTGILINGAGAFLIVFGVNFTPLETLIHHVTTAGEVFSYEVLPGFAVPLPPPPATILRAQQLEAWSV